MPPPGLHQIISQLIHKFVSPIHSTQAGGNYFMDTEENPMSESMVGDDNSVRDRDDEISAPRESLADRFESMQKQKDEHEGEVEVSASHL